MPKTRTISGIFFIPALLVLFWCTLFIWQSSYIAIDGSRIFCLFDDSLISLRYSWNLAHGEGLVWNPGERVEGFTSPLWVLLLSLPALFLGKSQLVLFVQVLGLLLLLGMGYFSSRLAAVLFTGRPEKEILRRTAFLLPALYHPVSFLTLGGMETGLLTLLFLASLDRVLRTPFTVRPDFLLPTLLGSAFLTRPDAALFIAGIFLYRAWRAPGDRVSLAGLGWELAVVGASVAGIQIFRWFYYGMLVPNTYLVKVAGISLGLRIPNGLLYLFPVLPPLLVPIFLAVRGTIRERIPGGWLVVSLFLSYIAYTIWVGGDFIPHPRFLAPLILPLIMVGTRTILPSSSRPRPVLAPVFLLLLTLLAGAPFLPGLVLARPLFNQDWNKKNTDQALVLREILRPQAKVAVTWAGAIPYWTGLRGVDILGKCDPVVARAVPSIVQRRKAWQMLYYPGHSKIDLDHSILRLQPDFVQAFVFAEDDPWELTVAVKYPYQWMAFPGVGILDGFILRRDSPDIDWAVLDRIRRKRNLSPPKQLITLEVQPINEE